MKKKIWTLLALVLALGICGCNTLPDQGTGSGGGTQTPPEGGGTQETPGGGTQTPPEGGGTQDPPEGGGTQDPPEEKAGIEALGDPTFQEGFYLRGLNSAVDGTAAKSTIRLGDGEIAWSVGQWYSRYDLNLATPRINDARMILSDESKRLDLDRNTGTLTMELAASLEYDTSESSRIYWPHLLIEQSFGAFSSYRLDTFSAVNVTLDFSVLGAQKGALETKPDSETLPAQFLQYFYVRDINADSEGFNNFLWFGLGYLDTRYKCMPLSYLQDHAGGNAGNYIYCLGAETTLGKGDFEYGREYNVRIDILPYIAEALENAHENGFMLGTEVADCAIMGMNLGWEVVGVWDIASTIGNLSVRGVPKEKNA